MNTDLVITLVVLIVLFLLAIAYNRYVVEEMEKRGIKGRTWAQVVGGVSFTLVGAAVLIGWQAALLVIGCFVASGIPMIVGAIRRHQRRLKNKVQ